MSENQLVSIIILNYNAGDLLLNCVDSVFKSTYPNFEVIGRYHQYFLFLEYFYQNSILIVIFYYKLFNLTKLNNYS